MNINNNHEAITEIIKLYFDGTYYGDAKKLRQAFHEQAHITGNINGQIHDWTLEEFITRVTQAPAAAKNEEYYKKLVFIDQQGNVAMAKTLVKVASYMFTDYITLLKINGHWIIRNKSFSA